MSQPLPHSLDIIRECLPDIKVPEEAFDPRAEWEHKYLAWVALRGNAGKSRPGGGLGIRRKLRSDGIVELRITQKRALFGPNGSARVHARISCKNDSLSTPLSWKIGWDNTDWNGKPIEYVASEISGELSHGAIVQHGEKVRRIEAPASFTSNWCLLDAIQRLPFDTKPISFCMLEDLDLMKPNQVLRPGEEVEVEMGGRKMRLHSFVQIGDGNLPYTYWFDDNHRLMLAIGGLYTYLFNPTVSLPEEES